MTPIRMKPWQMPFALKPKIDAEHDCLIEQGILEPVTQPKWETPDCDAHEGHWRHQNMRRLQVHFQQGTGSTPVPDPHGTRTAPPGITLGEEAVCKTGFGRSLPAAGG